MKDNLRAIRIERSTVIYVLMLFFMLPPGFFVDGCGRAVHVLFLLGELACYAYIFMIWLKKRRVSAVLALACCLYGVILISTFINGGNTIGAFRGLMRYIFIIMWFENESEKRMLLWKAITIYLTLMIALNLCSIIAFPNGLYTVNKTFNGKVVPQYCDFFSIKNGIGKYSMCLLFFKGDYDYNRQNKLSLMFYVAAFMGIFTNILQWSATSIVCVGGLAALIIIAPLIKSAKPKIYNIYFCSFMVALAFLMCVVMQKVRFLYVILVDVLHKNLRFGGRTPIWNAAIARIAQKPWLGYGVLTNANFRTLIGIRAAADAHDYYLTLCVNGGLIALGLFLAIYLIVIKSIRKRQYSYSGIVITAFFTVFFFMMVFENTSNVLYWIILAYGYSLKTSGERYEKVCADNGRGAFQQGRSGNDLCYGR